MLSASPRFDREGTLWVQVDLPVAAALSTVAPRWRYAWAKAIVRRTGAGGACGYSSGSYDGMRRGT